MTLHGPRQPKNLQNLYGSNPGTVHVTKASAKHQVLLRQEAQSFDTDFERSKSCGEPETNSCRLVAIKKESKWDFLFVLAVVLAKGC